MAFFGRNTILTQKQLRSGGMMQGSTLNMGSNKVMQGWMKNKNIARALVNRRKQEKFFKDVQAVAKKYGKLDKNGMREVLGKYWAGKGGSISKTDAMKIAGEFFKGSGEKKYTSFKEASTPKTTPKSLPQAEKTGIVEKKVDIPASLKSGSQKDLSVNIFKKATRSNVKVRPVLRTFNMSNIKGEEKKDNISPENKEMMKKVRYWQILNEATKESNDEEKDLKEAA